MLKFTKEYDNNSKILIFLISVLFFIIIYYHHFGNFLFYHSDYNTIIGNITYYLNHSKWNTDTWATYTYQIFPQKITAYTIIILDFFLGNYENFNSRNWIGFIFRIYLFISAILTVHFTLKIYKFFFKEVTKIVIFLFLTSYIFYFCFTEIRNDGFYVFFVTLITFKGIEYYENPNIKNIFLLSLFFALSLCTRLNSISLIMPILTLAIICLKENKIVIKKFLYHSFVFLFVFIFFYLLINFRSFDFYINYYHSHPLFNDYSGLNFFQSFSGTKQLSIFWYLDYWFTSGSGIILTTLSIVGVYLFLSSSNYHNLKLKFFILSVPISILLMLAVHQVVADRYSFGLIPFIIFFSSISLKKLYFENKLLNKVFFYTICSFCILKITLWSLTFFQDSTRLKSIKWINENIPKGSGIILYDMYDWNSKVFNELNQNYSIWQYISPDLNIDDVEQLSRLGYEYYLHGETGFQNYYPQIKPYLKDNKNAHHMKKKFENFYSNFIKKTDLKAFFHNKIYESGLFHSKGYDTSNYLKDIYQPVLQISKIKQEYNDNNFFIFDTNSLSKKFYAIKNLNGINYVKLKKNNSSFYEYKGPNESLPKGSYKVLVSLKKLDDIDSKVAIKIMVLNKGEISSEEINVNKKKYIYEREININTIGKNQIQISLSTSTDKILINKILIKKLNTNKE